ncbi:MAG TPA: hypothetical protein ENF54_00205 [Desulfobacteraceae bacterium]|nr:hypothetical protein [Desulfobacteraceae bacterium]
MKRYGNKICALDFKDDIGEFNSAISLHSHTIYSKENLGIIARYANRIPIIRALFRKENLKRIKSKKRPIDFSSGYWIPPLSPESVYISEKGNIEYNLDLNPIITVSDHDDLTGCLILKSIYPETHIPISFEWTVPLNGHTFHLGIYNIPYLMKDEIMEILRDNKGYDVKKIKDILDSISMSPEALIVLNHPLSQISDTEDFHGGLKGFINEFAPWIHALEINGFRSQRENDLVIKMAHELSLPVVGGGDRHASAPNSVLSLTKGHSFSEFVSEIRHDRISHIIYLPSYKDNLLERWLESIADFFRYYPKHPISIRRWTDRVFFRLENGIVRPLSYYWHQTIPFWVKSVVFMINILTSRYIRPTLKVFFNKEN